MIISASYHGRRDPDHLRKLVPAPQLAKPGGTLGRADTFQRQHTPVAVPVAVLCKFSEDQSANLASMIAFWAFFCIFPCSWCSSPCSGSS